MKRAKIHQKLITDKGTAAMLESRLEAKIKRVKEKKTHEAKKSISDLTTEPAALIQAFETNLFI